MLIKYYYRKQLMENPHYETGSQDLVLISCGESQVLKKKYIFSE
jgi:hypothetical protein